MNLTRRHFQEMADIIKSTSFADDLAKERMAERVADFLGQNNARFDRDKFLERCGVA